MFSVVIPLYNKEKSVVSTIKSVLAQTIPDFEIVVVNDGSTDKSRTVVASIEDDRIRIIDKPNGGVSSARNSGILASRYQYIAFIDADDYWEIDFLYTIKGLIEDFPEVGGYGTAYVCKINNLIINAFSVKVRGVVTDFFKQVYKGPIFHSSSVCIKKGTFGDIGYFDERISRGEDYNMWARLALRSSMAASPEPKVWYTLDAENRAMYTLPEPSKLWLYYINKEDITNDDQKKYYQRFLHRQFLTYVIKGKYKWAREIAYRNWTVASWYSYLYVPSYFQFRQLKTFKNLVMIKLDKVKK